MKEQRMRNDLQEGYRQLFKFYPHEVMITVHFGNRVIQNETAYKFLKELVNKIAKARRTQVAGFGIYNLLKTSHAHLLLYGKTRTLNALLKSEVDRFWRYGSVDVKTEVDSGAAFYLALNTTPNCYEKFELFFFNMRVLKKYRLYIKNLHGISRQMKPVKG